MSCVLEKEDLNNGGVLQQFKYAELPNISSCLVRSRGLLSARREVHQKESRDCSAFRNFPRSEFVTFLLSLLVLVLVLVLSLPVIGLIAYRPYLTLSACE